VTAHNTDTQQTATQQAIGHVTSADGTRIAYERGGEGPPLVLVHGTSADHTRWAPVLPQLQQRFTTYAVDRRGRGLSGDTGPYALEREFEDITAVVDSIGEPVDLLGHSYGGLCALEAALRSRQVRRLVLYEPAFRTDVPFYDEDPRPRLDAMIARGEREEALVTFFREVVGMSEAELAMMRAAPSWQGRMAAVHTIPREFADLDYEFDAARIGALAIPVLLLQGSQSVPALLEATRLLHAALPASTLEVMHGEAHVAITTAPDLFARLVMEFLVQ
jgi:pimeloyl-ACP methyl ester carboxylesterase